jgi:anti-sigma B factor antagonist
MAVMADPQHLPAVVIALPADIDMANAGQAGQQLGSAIASGVKAVIADMTLTRFCDSSGIAMLVQAHRQAVANGTELRLVVRSTAMLRALALVRLDDPLAVYPKLGPGPGHGTATTP